jgi:hypothetical protein
VRIHEKVAISSIIERQHNYLISCDNDLTDNCGHMTHDTCLEKITKSTQLGERTKQTLFLRGNRSGHDDTEHRHAAGQMKEPY